MSGQGKCSSSSAGTQEKGKVGDETGLCTKISAKLSFTPPLISFCKNSAPVTDSVAYHDKTG
jgi:hypothetical protein